jgi:hypothetical protein
MHTTSRNSLIQQNKDKVSAVSYEHKDRRKQKSNENEDVYALAITRPTFMLTRKTSSIAVIQCSAGIM